MRWEYSNSLEMSTFGGDMVPAKTERRRRGTVPYRIRVAREEYKKLKPILEAKKEEERRKKKGEARRKEVELEGRR